VLIACKVGPISFEVYVTSNTIQSPERQAQTSRVELTRSSRIFGSTWQLKLTIGVAPLWRNYMRLSLVVLLPLLLTVSFGSPAVSQTPIPVNAHKNITGGWDCDRGFRQTGNSCLLVEVPGNAHLEPVLGHTWDCNKGYRQVGNACVVVDVPVNAHLEPALG